MSVSLTPGGRWKAQCTWNDAKYYIGLFHTREAGLEAVAAEYAKLRDGTSKHLDGSARMTMRDFAADIRVPLSTIKRWVGEGLPVVRIGALVRIDPSEATAWVKANRPKSVAIGRAPVVYVAQRDSDDAVKIGFSSDIERRLRELRKEEHCAVCLVACAPGDSGDEFRLHEMFDAHRIEGEWFAIDPRDAVRAMTRIAA